MNTDAIESREQNLIQRIRTSGLVQSREVLLVDEVLEIRKERRQLFTKMNGEISMLQEMSQRWEQKALSLEQRIDQLQHEFLRREEDRKIKDREEIENAKQEMLQHKEKEASLAQAEFSRREEIMKIRYENQLQELAAKIEQVTIEQKSHDLTQAKLIANKLVKKISSELEEKFLRKVREYKESLVQVAEREKQLEEQLTEKEKSIVELTQKEKLMMDTLNSLQSRLEAVYLQEKEQERRKMQLIHENDSLRENNAALEKKLEDLKSSHETALQAVDEKVRKMLVNKSNEITELKLQLSNISREKLQLESVFSDLGRNLNDTRDFDGR